MHATLRMSFQGSKDICAADVSRFVQQLLRVLPMLVPYKSDAAVLLILTLAHQVVELCKPMRQQALEGSVQNKLQLSLRLRLHVISWASRGGE